MSLIQNLKNCLAFLVLAAAGVAGLALFGPLLEGLLKSQPGGIAMVLRYLPVVVLMIPGWGAIRFRQNRVLVLCLTMAALYHPRLIANVPSPEQRLVVLPVLACLHVALYRLNPRSLLSLRGIIRVVCWGIVLVLLTESARFVPEIFDKAWSKEVFRVVGEWDPAGDWLLGGLWLLVGVAVSIRASGPPRPSALVFALSFLLLGAGWKGSLFGLGNELPVMVYRWPLLLTNSLLIWLGMHQYIWKKVYTDELTGVFNRRRLEEDLQHSGRHFKLAMTDIDHFKKFNDTYGHQVGDQVLAFVARKLARSGLGRVYRYGGEEFTILCRHGDLANFQVGAERTRGDIADSRFVVRAADRPVSSRQQRGKTSSGKRKSVGVTISIGLAQRRGNSEHPAEVIKRADQALYKAKRTGRNRVVVDTG